MMPARSVDMPVSQFFRRGMPDVHDFNIKHQCLARQGMVGIDVGCVPARLGDCDSSHSLRRTELHDVAWA